MHYCFFPTTTGIIHGDFQGMNIIVPEHYTANVKTFKSISSLYLPCLPGYRSNSNKHSENDGDCNTNGVFSSSTSSSPDYFSMLKRNIVFKKEELLSLFGLIDFEDIQYSYLVLEVGRAIADAMSTFIAQTFRLTGPTSDKCEDNRLHIHSYATDTNVPFLKAELDSKGENVESFQSDALNIGSHILCGYLITNEMTVQEYSLIWPAVLISLCQYYILGKTQDIGTFW